MEEHDLRNRFSSLVILSLFIISAGCNFPASGQNTQPTLSVTEAYQTVEARLTEVVAQTPSPSATNVVGSPTPPDATSPSVTTPAPTSTPVPPTATQIPTATKSCDLIAPGNPIDVTIPDDTQMQPGQSFTKTWRLTNIGACTWSKDYKLALFSGESMGAATSNNLAGDVAPGQSVDLSVDMVAPQKAGKYQGNWKLQNASGTWFGIGPSGGSPFWVRIAVVQTSITPSASPTVTFLPSGTTPAPTTTPTPTTQSPTLTPTPVIQAGGIVALKPGQQLDLDVNQITSGAGADLSYENNEQGQHLLTPVGGAQLGVFGSAKPSLQDCRSAALSNSPQVIENLLTGIYFCYHTGQGLTGRALLANFNRDTYVLTLETLTWAAP